MIRKIAIRHISAFALIILFSCENKPDLVHKTECLELKMNRCYLFFEKGFQGEQLDVFVNGKHETRILQTDPSMDLAGEIVILTDTITNITFRIDNQLYGEFCPYPFIQINNIKGQIEVKVAEEPTHYE